MENWENLLNLPFVITYCRKSRRRFPQFTYPTHTELYTKSVRKNIHRSQCCGVHQFHSQNVLNINGLSIWSFMKIIFCGKSFPKICMQNNIRYRPILAENSHTIPSKLVSMRLYQWMFNLMVPLRYSKIYTAIEPPIALYDLPEIRQVTSCSVCMCNNQSYCLITLILHFSLFLLYCSCYNALSFFADLKHFATGLKCYIQIKFIIIYILLL